VRALDQFLVTRITKATTAHHLFVTAAQSILAAGGDLDIEALARASGVSSRTLRRSFGSLLGLSPKQLAQVTRFQYVRDALWENPNASLADLSLAAGYADQAHMQRDFRRFSRKTPRAFATEMRATRALFAPEAVRNLQSL
jgi:transcriptional regulator GlxA family with amidase domain